MLPSQAPSSAICRLLSLRLGVWSLHMLGPLGAIGTTPRGIRQVRLGEWRRRGTVMLRAAWGVRCIRLRGKTLRERVARRALRVSASHQWSSRDVRLIVLCCRELKFYRALSTQ